jgi:hypothetical protein
MMLTLPSVAARRLPRSLEGMDMGPRSPGVGTNDADAPSTGRDHVTSASSRSTIARRQVSRVKNPGMFLPDGAKAHQHPCLRSHACWAKRRATITPKPPILNQSVA